MRTLILFRGSPGCGKSTFIEKNNLLPYTISADSIRLMISSPVLNISGGFGIEQKNDKDVWNQLFIVLERRMQNGDLTVVDATNSKTAEMNKYKELAEQYRYRIICVDMTDVPIEVAKERNNQRSSYKIVPEQVIDNMYARFSAQKIPSGIEVVKHDELLNKIQYKTTDLTNYNKIIHFGDIHGCFQPLKEYFDKFPYDENNFYIFSGDYVDRGIENCETLNFLFSLYNKKNVALIEGNHETHLWKWSNGELSKSDEFNEFTSAQLTKLDKKEARMFYRKLRQIVYYTYGNKSILVTHAGISNDPENLMMIPTIQFIKGVGRYGDMEEVCESFVKNTHSDCYQIFGHRNVSDKPIQINERCFNLEGKIEFGGNLRIVTLDKNGFETMEIKNNVWNKERYEVTETRKIETPIEVNENICDVIKSLKNNKNIVEKHFDNGISSFNFSKKVFWDKIWNEATTKARGLFVNMNSGKIVCRSYEKFFNLGETEFTKIDALRKSFVFPVNGFSKINGFLGMLGVHDETGEVIFASKSSIDSEYSNYFKTIFMKNHGHKLDKIVEYIKENNVTFVFEVIDHVNDPHIIEYGESFVVLLDIIHNDINFKKFPYPNMLNVAIGLDLRYKCHMYAFNNFDEFEKWFDEVKNDETFQYRTEGVVLEDASGFNVKVKYEYYRFWKFMRSVKDAVARHGFYKFTGSLTTPLANEFYGFVKNQCTRNELENMSIIELRNKFYKNKEINK